MTALEISNLSKSFGENKVINHLSLNVSENSVFGFLGQNGAGKTTTMKMILGLLKSDSGSIKVFGEEVSFGSAKTNRFIGYLPDVPEFYNSMNAREYLRFVGEISGLSKVQMNHKSSELLELVGLENTKKRIGGYSRGMKQRLGIAQALMNEPRLLICDEPTSALDPIGRKEILDILNEIKNKTTVIFSTHILSDVERICDEIAVLNNGEIVLCGKLEDIKSKRRGEKISLKIRERSELMKIKEYLNNHKFVNSSDIIEDTIIIEANSGKLDAGKVILKYLYENEIVPVKFERMEPDLESLFMEVVV